MIRETFIGRYCVEINFLEISFLEYADLIGVVSVSDFHIDSIRVFFDYFIGK